MFVASDVNIAQYEPDFAWQRTAEREHQRKSGVDLWVGSVSGKDIVFSRHVQINASLADRLRFRWRHEQYGDPELAITTEMLELQVRVVGPVALTLFSSGAFEKSGIAVGGGVLVAPGDRTSYLDLAVRHEGPAYNSKTHDDAKDRRPPLRLLGETNLESGTVRLYGFADWALESRRVFASPKGSDGVRDHRRYTRRTALKVEWSPQPDTDFGVRDRFTAQGDEREHFTDYVDPDGDELLDRDFDRTHNKLDVYGEHRFAAFRLRGIAGWWMQRDRTDPAIGTNEHYRRDQFLFGGRAHRSITKEIDMGAGYWGTSLAAKRDGSSPKRLDVYADKVDVVFGYHFNDIARAELVLSHELAAGGFGGASGKALFLF